MQDSKRLAVSKSSVQKEGEIFKMGESVEADKKQLWQEVCVAQSDASIWCMGEADRLADNNEAIKIMATATKNLLFLANGRISFKGLLFKCRGQRNAGPDWQQLSRPANVITTKQVFACCPYG